jgi:CBS domain-containing protein
MLAKDVMSGGVISITADATVLDAATLLVNTHVSAMPVLDRDGVMVGIVTEADLIPYAGLEPAAGKAVPDTLRTRRVAEIMTKNVITVDENAPLKDVVVLMAGKRIKRVPVRSGRSIVGIISRVDLLRVIASRATSAEAAAATFDSNDDKLRRDLLDAVKGQSWSVAQHLDVVVVGGTIHLWGVVPTEQVLNAYRKAAQNLPNVKSVVSHMQIMRPGIHPVGVH